MRCNMELGLIQAEQRLQSLLIKNTKKEKNFYKKKDAKSSRGGALF